MTHQEALFNEVTKYLESEGFRYSVEKEGSVISLNMSLKSKLRNCKEFIFVSESGIEAIAVSPIKASREDYNNVVEYITRANYGLTYGDFEFDYDDGEVRYKTYLSCKEGTPSMKDVERTVDIPVFMLQRYGDGLVKNLMGFGSPAEDIAAAEAN